MAQKINQPQYVAWYGTVEIKIGIGAWARTERQ